MKNKLETATFGAGCFWGVEDRFRAVKGVVDVISGYTGGHTSNPTYEQVCSGNTGHAESVQITFDPDVVSYTELLHIFWKNHNPTTRNRQGVDVGSQYRSVIFYHSDKQKQLAEKSRQQLEQSSTYENPIVTEITPASTFYKAEEYHQKYLEKHGGSACQL